MSVFKAEGSWTLSCNKFFLNLNISHHFTPCTHKPDWQANQMQVPATGASCGQAGGGCGDSGVETPSRPPAAPSNQLHTPPWSAETDRQGVLRAAPDAWTLGGGTEWGLLVFLRALRVPNMPA